MKLSLIGTGLMGSAIAEALLGAGHQLTVQNRTREKTVPLTRLGATAVDTAADAIRAADATILVLMDGDSTRQVLLSDAVKPLLAGRKLINVAFTTPEEIIALAADVAKAGGNLSELTVAAYPQHVRDKTSELLIASDAAHADLWCTLFRTIAPKVHHLGPVGNASKSEQALWLSYMFPTVIAGYCLAAFEKLGLPASVVKSCLNGNPVIGVAGGDHLIEHMSHRSYAPRNWTVDNMVASCDLVLDFVRSMNLQTEIFSTIKDFYVAASRKGLGDRDVTAVYEAIKAPPAT